jgi:hypothetical protein
MITNTTLHGGYMGLSLIFLLLISSCAPVSYDFIGTWNCQPDKLTYINKHQHIKLTLPDDKWRVYMNPTELPYKQRSHWVMPSDKSDAYQVLLAIDPRAALFMGLLIGPLPLGTEDMSENDMMDLMKVAFKIALKHQLRERAFDSELGDYKVIQRKGRSIGVVTIKVSKLMGPSTKCLLAVFKEKTSLTMLMFACLEDLFEIKANQFWDIIDSYEYLE